MDLLLTEMKRRTAFADALGVHAKNALVELQAAVDIGDSQIQPGFARWLCRFLVLEGDLLSI